jgi:ABC-type enterochelin transport system permease subunit
MKGSHTMTELILIALIAGSSFGLLFAYIQQMMNKDNYIAELQSALVDAYTELEFAKLGLMK